MSGTGTMLRSRIAEAAAWRLAALLLQRPRRGWHQEVMALAGEVDDTALRRAAREAAGACEETYLAVLGPGGAVSPREVGYCEQRDPGHLLADIAAFYRAFAYLPGSQSGNGDASGSGAHEPREWTDQCEPVVATETVGTEDPVDHVAVEADFLGYLRLKEAFAREGGDEEAAETTALGASRFIDAHLGTFAAELSRRLEITGPSYLALAASAVASRIPG